MIVLKNLAREFEIDAHKLRAILREQFGQHKRWRWPDDKDQELIKIRAFLKARPSRSTRKTPKKAGVVYAPTTSAQLKPKAKARRATVH